MQGIGLGDSRCEMLSWWSTVFRGQRQDILCSVQFDAVKLGLIVVLRRMGKQINDSVDVLLLHWPRLRKGHAHGLAFGLGITRRDRGRIDVAIDLAAGMAYLAHDQTPMLLGDICKLLEASKLLPWKGSSRGIMEFLAASNWS